MISPGFFKVLLLIVVVVVVVVLLLERPQQQQQKKWRGAQMLIYSHVISIENCRQNCSDVDDCNVWRCSSSIEFIQHIASFRLPNIESRDRLLKENCYELFINEKKKCNSWILWPSIKYLHFFFFCIQNQYGEIAVYLNYKYNQIKLIQ